MNSLADSPKKISGESMEIFSDSNMEIETTKKSIILHLLKKNLLLVVTIAGVVCGAVTGNLLSLIKFF